MKIAVIGCGSIGQRHIGNLIKIGHEVVAWNRNETRRIIVKKKFRIKTYKYLEEMLNISNLNAAVVCSPNNLHIKHIIKVMNRGLNIFVEKPLVTSLIGMKDVETIIKKKGLINHVGSNMRFHFGPKTIKEHLNKKTIGKVLWANFWGGMHLPDWHPNEDYREMYSSKKKLGGGVIMDFVHEIDLICWFFGKPNKLAAIIGRSGWLDIETEDIADVIMSYPKGLKLNLHLDYLQRPFQRGIHIIGSKGWIKWDIISENIKIYNHYKKKMIIKPYPKNYKHNDMYIDQMKYFMKCLKKRDKSECNFAVAKKAIETALEIKNSARTNKFIIRGKKC